MSTLQDEVLAWMADTGRGYKAASRHFDVPIDDVRAWGREARNPAAKSRASARARSEDEQPRQPEKSPTRRDLLMAQFVEAKASLDRAVEDRSHQAVASLRRQVLKIHEELEAVEKAEAEAAADDLTPAELEAELVATLTALPRDMVRRIFDAVLPTKLHVVS